MSEEQNKGSLGPISGVVIILAALGITVYSQIPFTGERPAIPELYESREKVPARLWQDPFLAVTIFRRAYDKDTLSNDVNTRLIDLSDYKKSASGDYLTAMIRRKIEEQQKQFGKKEVAITVLGVMVFGGAYSEDTEKRIRYRNAVLAGLHRLDFEPEDAEHIGYMIVQSSSQSPDIMPFEWFIKKPRNLSEREYVLLLWLNEEIFLRESDCNPGMADPLKKLGYLKSYMDAVGAGKEIQCKIIGPASSGLLQKMLIEVNATAPCPAGMSETQKDPNNTSGTDQGVASKANAKTSLEPQKSKERIINGTFAFKVVNSTNADMLKKMTIEVESKETPLSAQNKEIEWDPLKLGEKTFDMYAATATIDNALLLEGMGEQSPRDPREDRKVIEKKFESCGIRFERTISSDRMLAEKLIAELRLRHFNFKKDHIILISEWDSLYGRSLSDIYRQVLMETEIPAEVINTQLHRYSYLRGIDGVIARQRTQRKDDSQAGKSSDEGVDKSEEAKKIEDAYGKSQADYLRRLADEVSAIDQELKDTGRGIKAIGVLGNDYFDKYLVLQAFKHRFPQAIFFTSDLDARMTHPARIKYTRNLIVASSFDLTLRNDKEYNLQGDAQPFRDCYQTAIFYTTLRVFNFFDDKSETPPPPLMFEIGRNKTFLLTKQPDPGKTKGQKPEVRITKSSYDVQPRRTDIVLDRKLILEVMGALTMACLFLALTISWLSDKANGFFKLIKKNWLYRWGPFKMALYLLILVLVVFAFFHFILANPDEEPFSLFEGISIWPTEMLRLLACILSIIFLAILQKGLENNKDYIEKEFEGISKDVKPAANKSEELPDNPSMTPCGASRKPKPSWLKKIGEQVKTCWEKATDDLSKDKDNELTSIGPIWNEYMKRDLWSYGKWWFIPVFFTYWALCAFIILISAGVPSRPLRGTITGWLDYTLLFLSIVSFIVLLLYVFYHTRICWHFIKKARDMVSGNAGGRMWPQDIISCFASKNMLGSDSYYTGEMDFSHWMLIHLVAKRTKVVGELIFYPLLIWLIILLSRYPYFDNMYTPPGLAVVITLSAILAWICGYCLRKAAEDLRKATLHRLDTRRILILAQKEPNDSSVKLTEEIMQHIRSNQEGAFAPFMQHPLVRALVAPLGGASAVALYDLFEKFNF